MSTAANPTASPAQPASTLTWAIGGAGAALLVVLLGILLTQRRDEKLPFIYGKRRGTVASTSVNGTAVLSELYRSQGRRVGTVIRFSPALERYDTIVWIPDDFAPPDKPHREFLENWLANGFGRTVVYVGRDYDSAVDYWQHVTTDAPTDAPTDQADEFLRRQAEARARYESDRSLMPVNENVDWFVAKRDAPSTPVTSLSGPWADDIDAKTAALRLNGRLELPPAESDELTFETLLAADGEPLVTRITGDAWEDGQIIVVANGSFALNYALVNHENRKLAGKLIDASSVDGDRATTATLAACSDNPQAVRRPASASPTKAPRDSTPISSSTPPARPTSSTTTARATLSCS